MDPTVDSVFETALLLPQESRAILAERILGSLDEEIDPKIQQAWAEEAERRLKAYRSGEEKGIPLNEVFENLPGRRGS